MTPEKTTAFLKLLQAKVPAAQNRGGWIVCSCPMAPWTHDKGVDRNPAFAAKRESGDAFTHCFACGWKGKMSDLVLEMQYRNKVDPQLKVKWGDAFAMIEEAESESIVDLDFPDLEEMLFGDQAKAHVFPGWWLESFPPWREAEWAQDYLQERGVSEKVADALDIRADAKESRVCFPVRDFSGKLMGLHGRAIEKATEPRYRMYTQAKKNNPLIWLGEHWIDLDKPIVVVEGPFDLASVMRVYGNVTTPLFANPNVKKLKRMADALEWITLYDRGAGGDSGREKVSKTLNRDHMVTHLVPPEGRKDPGEMTTAELVELLGDSVPLNAIQLD